MTHFLKSLVRRLPQGRLRALVYHLWMRTRTTEQIFSGIHRHQAWMNMESISGPGSTLAATATLRSQLPFVFERHKIRRLLDIPCGDFNWMSQVNLDGIDYLGADVVPAIVKANQLEHSGRDRRFETINLIEGPLPDADALICRDCLIHLSFSSVRRVMENFRRSNIRMFLVSTYPQWQRNVDVYTGGWRPLNLESAPFHLPPPMEILEENDDGAGNPSRIKRMGVWTRSQLESRPWMPS